MGKMNHDSNGDLKSPAGRQKPKHHGYILARTNGIKDEDKHQFKALDPGTASCVIRFNES